MKKLLKWATLLVVVFSLTVIKAPSKNLIHAIECSGNPPTDINQLNDYIDTCQDKIQESQARQETLAATIEHLNTQINLTQAEIYRTKSQLEELRLEIEDLSGKIQSIDYSLEDLTKLFIQRVRESYKNQTTPPLTTLVKSDGLSDFVRRIEYIQRVKDHDRQVMIELEQSRLEYDDKKTAKEEKQAEVQALQNQLEAQRNTLAQQKTAKNELLEQTRNNEQRYQQLLAQALAEKAAIEKALVSGVEVGPVEKGEPIALVGNSGYPGCSTGKHLHFEVRKDKSWVDPSSYLASKSVSDEQSGESPYPMITMGSGSWPWPIQDTIRITQHYGKTPYSWRYTYSGGIHTGIDVVSTSSDVIRALADGTLYESSQSCGSSVINIVYIDHGDNLISLYLHVQ